MANPSRYRYIQFYGGRILESREVAEMQRIQEGLNSGGTARVAWDLDIIYREGATFNILPTISSGSITFSAINSSLPMYIFVRGRWEALQPSEVATMNLSTGGNVYLNWVLRQVTSSEDATLVDTNTGAPTADMGELDLAVSTTDTSGVSLASNQFEKNTVPIIVFNYSTGNVLVPIDNVNAIAYANNKTSGLVSLSTGTSNGEACSSDDPRLSNTRTPSTGTVVDASVRTPVSPGGTNVDGTAVYNLTSDAGGISSEKIVHITGTQLVGDAIEWIKAQLSNLLSLINNHIGYRLGLSNTHPMPSATDVGATPISHVGQPLGLATSHPPVATMNSGGFQLNRDSTIAPASNDPAYGLFSSGTVTAAIYHNGDVMSSAAGTYTASPLASSTLPSPASGSLALMSTMAEVLSQHVNQTVDANPHGLKLTDLTTGTQNTGSILISNGSSFVIRTYSVTDVTTSRVGNTAYQNTSAGQMDVSGSVNATGDANVTLIISPNSTFSPQIVRWASNTNGADLGFVGIVPQGYWYKLAAVGAISSVHYWSEGTWS